jgi:sec-independent protein translocase protein TatA
MGSLGMQEIAVIFILALIIFGPRKLPELGKTLGRSLAEFKKASSELKQTWEDEVRLNTEKNVVSDIIKESSTETKKIIDDINNSLDQKDLDPKEPAQKNRDQKDPDQKDLDQKE